MKSTTKDLQHERDYEDGRYADGLRGARAKPTSHIFLKWKCYLYWSVADKAPPNLNSCKQVGYFFPHWNLFPHRAGGPKPQRGTGSLKEKHPESPTTASINNGDVRQACGEMSGCCTKEPGLNLNDRTVGRTDFQWSLRGRRTIWCNLVHHRFLSQRICSFGASEISFKMKLVSSKPEPVVLNNKGQMMPLGEICPPLWGSLTLLCVCVLPLRHP